MEKTLEQLQVEFAETFGKEVPNNKKNDAEWIASKIAEAQKAEEENQTTNPDDNSEESEADNNSDDNTEADESEFKEDENRFNTEEDDEDEESAEVVDNEDYDDNSVDNQVMTQEARKVGNIVYPV
ncbi:MAG: hypothetical protein DLD55_01475 [candidate division SR1 bacterium]|nr:MAG: hypothetical protein DLD55_01475 [candidate division SR1 bacterium]